MKKLEKRKQLPLTIETIRPLTNADLSKVQGAGPGTSTHTGCGNRPTLN